MLWRRVVLQLRAKNIELAKVVGRLQERCYEETRQHGDTGPRNSFGEGHERLHLGADESVRSPRAA